MAKFEEQVNVNDISRITSGVVIKGDIISKSDIRIDGEVSGTLKSEGRIVVGENAVLAGSVECVNADIWGKMESGDLVVKDTLSLKSTAVINGNLNIRKLQVELGAKIAGNIKMDATAPATPQKK